MKVCDRYQIPTYLERSRSGNGAHVWFFFNAFIRASKVRKMGMLLLKETMMQSPTLSFSSFDRLIPNQDVLPKGGFGNLIALPLQRLPRYQGNSVFVNRDFEPYVDQWAYLASVRKIGEADVQKLTDTLSRHLTLGKEAAASVELPKAEDFTIEPWMPKTSHDRWEDIARTQTQKLSIVLAEGLYFDKHQMSSQLRAALIQEASFANPVFYERQAKRLSTRKIPRFISCAEEKGDFLLIPRGLAETVLALLDAHHIPYDLLDKRSLGSPVSPQFLGTLRPKQLAVAKHVLKSETGVLCAGTGFGKTVLGLYAIAQRGVSTLIITNRKQLAQQWLMSARIFLDLPQAALGCIWSGKIKPTGLVDIAMVQTLANQKDWQLDVKRYGMVIVDECHHAAAKQYETVLKRYQAKYFLGLSATPNRRDGLQPIVYMQCGPVRYRVNNKKENLAQPLMHILEVHETAFLPQPMAQNTKIQDLFKELIHDEKRNRQIAADILKAYRRGRCILVLTERREHLEAIYALLGGIERKILLYGAMRPKVREEHSKRFASYAQNQQGAVLLATGKLVGEGFDIKKLDTLILAMPISDKSLLIQYVGRLHRLCDGKVEVKVIDYHDSAEPRLNRMFLKRQKVFKAIGYEALSAKDEQLIV